MKTLSLQDIITIATGVVAIASIIVKATPTPKDDEFLAQWIYPALNWLALNKKSDCNKDAGTEK